MKVLLVAALLVGLAVLAPPASACCHILHLRQDAGPCHVEWEGDAFHGYTEYVEAGCLGESARVAP